MTFRNRHLRQMREHSLGICRSIEDTGIAALLLDALSDKQIAAATGMTCASIHKRLVHMRKRAGVANRVGLALKLQSIVMAEGGAT